MKKGEQEAKTILQNEGIIFDEKYYDNNSEEKMPDLKEKDGKFWEVTHTNHNDSVALKMNKFQRKSIDEKNRIINKACESYDRIVKNKYPRSNGKLTADGQKQYEKDLKIVSEYFGIDIKAKAEQREFKCDNPIIEWSVDNIIYAINKKARLHPQNDTNLFVFISQEENELLVDLLESNKNNIYYTSFENCILNSPFDIVYLCVRDFYEQRYDLDKPILYKFVAVSGHEISYSTKNKTM